MIERLLRIPRTRVRNQLILFNAAACRKRPWCIKSRRKEQIKSVNYITCNIIKFLINKVLDVKPLVTYQRLYQQFDQYFNQSCFSILTGYTTAVAGNGNKNCYQYDVQNNKWTNYLSLQFPHLGSSGTVYQNKLYIFDNPYSEAIDLITKTGVESIPTPNATAEGACTIILEDSVLVIGGRLSRYCKDINSLQCTILFCLHIYPYFNFVICHLS